MNNSIQSFDFQSHSVRTVEKNGEVWFVAKDICDALGYTNSREAVRKHVDDEDKGVTKRDTLGGDQELQAVNESGMYSLVLRSRKSEAKSFKRWVTSEVLPSIRRTGSYQAVSKVYDPVRILVCIDPDGEQRSFSVGSDAFVVSPNSLPGMIADRGYFNIDQVQAIAESCIRRLSQRGC